MKGEGNQQDYGMRVYDARLGRFLSVDPLTKQYPHYTPYQFSGNTPIKFIDLDGAEEYDPASKPTGITHLTNAKVPGGDETKSVWLGNYEMQGFRAANGSAYWIARYHHTEGQYAGLHQDEFVVGPDAFGKFARDSKNYHNKSQWMFWGGTNTKIGFGLLGETLKEGWKPQNIVMGTLALVGSGVALASARNAMRETAKEVLNPKEVHFMQSSIKNTTGEYTVLDNAEALKAGTLKPEVLKINVWKDATGKVWTLDHRRLAAFRLSGLNEVPVNWARPEQVQSQMWKMTTTTSGESIKLKLGNGVSQVIK